MMSLRSPQIGYRRLFETASAGVLLQGLLLVSGVIAARVLGPTNRGYLALMTVTGSLVCQIGGFGLSLAVSYFIATDHDVARPTLRQVRRVVSLQLLVLTLVDAGVLLFLFRGAPGDAHVAALISLVGVPGTLLVEYSTATLQGLGRFRSFNVLRVLSNAIYAVVLVVSFFGVEQNLIFVSAAAFPPLLLVGCAGAVYTWRVTGTGPASTARSLRTLTWYGVRSWVGALSPIDTFRLDQLAVGLMLGPAPLGVYVVGSAFANLPRFVAQSIGMVASPTVAGSARNRRRLAWHFAWIATVASLLIVAPLELVAAPLVHLLFGYGYRGAAPVTRILLLAALAVSIRRVLTDALRGAGHPALGAVGEVAALGMLAPLLPLGAHFWGVEGVAWALAASSFLGCASLAVAFARAGKTTSRSSWSLRIPGKSVAWRALMFVALGALFVAAGLFATWLGGAGWSGIAGRIIVGSVVISGTTAWWWRRTKDLPSLLVLSAAFYLLAYCAGALFYWVQPGARYLSLTNRSDIQWALDVAIMSWILLFVGYACAPLRWALPLIPRLPAVRESSNLRPILLVMFVIGWLARIDEIRQGRYFHAPAGGEIVSSGTTQFVVVFAVLPTLVTGIVIAHDYLAREPIGTVLNSRRLGRALLLAEFAWYLPTGGRGNLVGLLMMFGILSYYGRGRRVPWRVLVPTIIVCVFVLFPFGLAYRASTVAYQSNPRAALKSAAGQMLTSSPSTIASNGVNATFSRFSDVMSLALIHTRGRSTSGIVGGRSLGWAAASAVPRFIDPHKTDPGLYGNQFGRSYDLIYVNDLITSISVTQPGELFLAFGWLGLLIGMPLIGAFYRLINDYLGARDHLPIELALFAVMAWPLLNGQESIVALGVAGVGRSLAIYAALLIVIARVFKVYRSSSRDATVTA